MTSEIEPGGADERAAAEAPTTPIETATGPVRDEPAEGSAVSSTAPASAAPAPSQASASPAPEPSSVPAASEPSLTPTTAVSRPRQAAGAAGQAAGVIGIVVCLLLIVGVILARGWLVDQVTGIEGSLDSAVAKGITLTDDASSRVSQVSGRVGAIADAASALSTNPNPAPELTQALLGQLSGVSDRYLALRQSYAGAREVVVSGVDRLQTLDRLLPFFSLPQGPVDALQSLDTKAKSLDAAIMDMLNAPGANAVNAVAGKVAEGASNAEATLTQVAADLNGLSARLGGLQTNIAAKADQARTTITLVALLFIAGLLYLAFLHVVLFRSSGGFRRRT
jgi:hypothetical protein